MSRRETNPHFSRPRRAQHEDHHQQPPFTLVPPHQEHDRGAPMQQQDLPYHSHLPLRPHPREDHFPLHPHPREDHSPLRSHQAEDHLPPPISKVPRGGQPPRQGGRRQKVNLQDPSLSSPKSRGSPVLLPPPDYTPERRQPLQYPRKQPHEPRRPPPDLKVPRQQKSKPLTWCGAVFCVIFWLIIIIGGLIVLIVYLVFRPQSPHFDVSSVTLNAADLDFGYLLNADLTILANFTNPNKKVHVDFSSVIIYIYYGSTLIATQYVEPFSAARVQSRFAYIHMVTSQVQLPLGESQRLLKQMESNGVLFQVRGVFRARSKLGSILRYSYNLYGLCNVMVTRPPDGILLKRRCRTKR